MTDQLTDVKMLKKEMALIVKENKRLNAELKTKNESLATLINQNFTEMTSLHEKYEKNINSITAKYDENISKLNHQYAIYRNSLHIKLKDNISTRYNLNNERARLLTKHNETLVAKLESLQKENLLLTEKKSIINSEHIDQVEKIEKQLSEIKKKYSDQVSKNTELEISKSIMEKKINEVMSLYENYTQMKNNYESKMTYLANQNDNLQSDLHMAQQELGKGIETIKSLTTECDSSKNIYQNLHSKHLLLLNDNMVKQTNIDEKNLEILSLNTKIAELEKRNLIHESYKNESTVKIVEQTEENKHLQNIISELNRTINELKNENNAIRDDKDYFSTEMENYKQKLRQTELKLLSQIKNIQDSSSMEKEKYILDYESRIKATQEKYDNQIFTIKSETSAFIMDKEKQIDGLTNYLKVVTDNQYLVLTELEKNKQLNEKLKMENNNVDQKINEIQSHYKTELEELKSNCKKEKDLLMENYTEKIQKSQELNDALQHRLNQIMDTLTISRTTISNLKETNNHLEKQFEQHKTDDGTYQEKINQLRTENSLLREKLDRSVELNNNFSNKEKQYETIIGQLRTKYSQLVAITKKNINSSIN